MKKSTILAFLSVAGLVGCSDVTTEVYSPVYGEGYYITTPQAAETPAINGAEVFGVRPNHPFLYTIPTTGIRPITFGVENLPEGLVVDAATGIISGTIKDSAEKSYQVVLTATNEKGADKKSFEIIVGEEICLTPPLGWNSWNCWGTQVTQKNVEASAQAMYDKGLVNYGWSYINIDDAWQDNKRGGEFNAIMPDPVNFPDVAGMCDRIHSMGMKVGIYSSPWVTTYAKHMGGSSYNKDGKWDESMVDPKGAKGDDRKYQAVGTYKFDDNDAKQWAAWGIDYLKYDWYKNDPESTTRMAKALRASGRDIIFSLSNTCPQDMEPVCSEYVQCWRTAGDLKDRWNTEGMHKSIIDILPIHREWVNGVFEGKPGHFADPDMLVVGYMDRGYGNEMTPSTLSADEQYSHIALWSLWSAPLLIGCPIEKFDDFTLALLTNSEVLAINQDRKAIAGKSVVYNDSVEIIVKELYNGDKAVGMFNMSDSTQTITADWATIGVEGKQQLRDAWRQVEIGTYMDKFEAVVPSHGNVLVVFKSKE